MKGSIPKNQFPGLLLRLQNRLKPSNITAGFKASGIWPVDRNAVLKRLPQSRQDTGGTSVSETFNVSIEDILMKHCGPGDKKKQPRGRKIVPGRAIVPVAFTIFKDMNKISSDTSITLLQVSRSRKTNSKDCPNMPKMKKG